MTNNTINSSLMISASDLQILIGAELNKVETTLLAAKSSSAVNSNTTDTYIDKFYAGHGTAQVNGSGFNSGGATVGSIKITKLNYIDDNLNSDGTDVSFTITGTNLTAGGNNFINGGLSKLKVVDGNTTLKIDGKLGLDGNDLGSLTNSNGGFHGNMNAGQFINHLQLTDTDTGVAIDLYGKFGGNGNGGFIGTITAVDYFDGGTNYTFKDGLNFDLVKATPTSISNLIVGGDTVSGSFTKSDVGTAGDDMIRGTNLNDSISGGTGNDLIHSGAGADTVDGGTGDNVIQGGEGNDIIKVTDSTGLNILDGGAGNDSITGGSGDDTITGGLGNDILNGGAGSNNISGGEGNDIIKVTDSTGLNILDGGAGNDSITGGSGDDTITGGLGNDVLNGGAGSNNISGGDGNDTITVGNGATLSSGTNTLDGGAGNDSITGGSGDDTITGGEGNDNLAGGAGNDVLDGGIGIDNLKGGAGDDTYYINDINISGKADTVIENVNQGIDTVISSIAAYTLTANVENLTLANGAADGTGNNLANIIIGNAGDNIISGGLGNDTLTGGGGSNTFVFNTKIGLNQALVPTNVDTITDFTSSDTINLSKLIFSHAVADGVSPSNLSINDLVSGLSLDAAAASRTGNEHFLFETTTGALYYDADGAGSHAAVQFATLIGVTTLAASDIELG